MNRLSLLRSRWLGGLLLTMLIAGWWSWSVSTIWADNAPAAFSDPAAYTDVSSEAYYYNYVQSLARAGVFDGTDCENDLFCPSQPLKRWRLAVWLIRSMGETELGRSDQPRFTDVEPDSWYSPHVERMADLEITTGCTSQPARYCPDDNVTRAQMASFLVRAFGLPPAEPAGFVDVGPDGVHADNINRLAAARITVGCSQEPLSYCPNRAVTKAQMSAFIFRGLDWLQRQSIAESSPVRPDIFLTEYNQLSHFIKTEIVDRYGDEQPWLRATWNFSNQSDFKYQLYDSIELCQWACSVIVSPYALREAINAVDPSEHSELELGELSRLIDLDRLEHPLVLGLLVGSDRWLSGEYHDLFFHELAHIYTLAERIADNSLPLAAAHLYFSQLMLDEYNNQPVGNRIAFELICAPMELYADTIQVLGPQPPLAFFRAPYWQLCPHLPLKPTAEAEAVAQAALAGQPPQWFDQTFRDDSGQIEYGALWWQIRQITDPAKIGRVVVINQLRDAFGGFCSDQQVHRLLLGEIDYADLIQPWVDGGCGANSQGQSLADYQVCPNWLPPETADEICHQPED